ncbi:hypothetical protein T4C_2688 [Trichinella pseudospiralis]|uniref:Uncharacterized protein n=1 Tax=Trichinella pseudospiralis TaxID=6337 RepID=A0A0V1GS91_TRIPS|nr:hypothetical protein T4C_2688 [Trichinella pseudospiralis]
MREKWIAHKTEILHNAVEFQEIFEWVPGIIRASFLYIKIGIMPA